MHYDLIESKVKFIRITNNKAPLEKEKVQYFEVYDPLENCKRIRRLKYVPPVFVDLINGQMKVYYSLRFPYRAGNPLRPLSTRNAKIR